MTNTIHTRHPLIGLIDEVVRAGSRLSSVFALARQGTGLGQSEFLVLNAVVEADRAPTAAQIGRSLGRPRQLVQRAANALIEEGLIAAAPNPDHLRAVLLVPTERGTALKREADGRADAMASQLGDGLDLARLAEVTGALGNVRRELELRLRKERI